MYRIENFIEEVKTQDRLKIIEKMDEVLTKKIKERKYDIIYDYYQFKGNNLPHRPLSEFIDKILFDYDYGVEKNLIGEGLEPALVVGNARRIISDRLGRTIPTIPYSQRYIFSYRKVDSLKLEDEDFGIAIYGDEHHVSGVLTRTYKNTGDVAYVFDSTGDLHQKSIGDGTCEIDKEKISRNGRGMTISLNPLGFKFQGGYSDTCGFWSSCFIAEASKYKSVEDFTIKVNYEERYYLTNEGVSDGCCGQCPTKYR